MITRLIFDFLNSGRQPGYALRLVRYTRLHPAECRAWEHAGTVEDAERVVGRCYFHRTTEHYNPERIT